MFFAKHYRWGKGTRLLKLVSSLRDDAATFYAHLRAEVRDNFAALQKALHDKFGASQPPENYQWQLATIQQLEGETVKSYGDRASRLAMYAYPDYATTDRTARAVVVSTFIKGLRNQLFASIIRAHAPTSVEAAISLLARLEVGTPAATPTKGAHFAVQTDTRAPAVGQVRPPSPRVDFVECWTCVDPGEGASLPHPISGSVEHFASPQTLSKASPAWRA